MHRLYFCSTSNLLVKQNLVRIAFVCNKLVAKYLAPRYWCNTNKLHGARHTFSWPYQMPDIKWGIRLGIFMTDLFVPGERRRTQRDMLSTFLTTFHYIKSMWYVPCHVLIICVHTDWLSVRNVLQRHVTTPSFLAFQNRFDNPSLFFVGALSQICSCIILGYLQVQMRSDWSSESTSASAFPLLPCF